MTNVDDPKMPNPSSTRTHLDDMSTSLTAREHSGLRQYVPDRCLHATTLTAQNADNDLKASPHRGCHSTAPSFDRPREPNSIDSSLICRPLRKCLHGTSLTNLNFAGVETLDDKGVPVDCSDKHFQINFHQTIKTKQRKKSRSQIIKLRLCKPVLQVIKIQPEVAVVPHKALHVHELLSTRFLEIVKAVQINDMGDGASLSTPDNQAKELDVAFHLDLPTAEAISIDLTKSVTPDNEFEWSLVQNRQISRVDTLESPLSILSPLSPFTDTEELISSYESAEPLCRDSSITSDISIEGHPAPLTIPKNSCTGIIVNGKLHAHPLRSNPVTEADCISLPETPACLFPPRTDSLPSSTSSKGSVCDAISPRTTRPPFPPRKDSLLPLNSFLNAPLERPRTSHVPNRSSRIDFFTTTNKSELSLAIPAQKAKLLHRRSASVADLFHSLTTKSANRSQSVAPQVSAPILIQAPTKPPATAPVPSKVQASAYPVTPYTMQPPFRSHTWNMSQVSTHSSANTSNLSTDISPSHNASQTSLHSNNANRRAFVMQRPNTSVVSLHSQNSKQDLHGMLSGYNTHIKDATVNHKTQDLAPPVPPKNEEIERLDRRGSETVRIPAPVPVDLKERRFRRVLNLRRANAAFTTTLNTAKANSPHPSPSALSPVKESGFSSRRGSVYAALAPSMIQIDVAGAAEVRRQSEFRGGVMGMRRR